MNRQSMFNTGQDAWGWCMGMIQRDDMGWEGGSGLGTHVHPWLIHVNVWQNQYSTVKQNKVQIKIKKKKAPGEPMILLSSALLQHSVHTSSLVLIPRASMLSNIREQFTLWPFE